MSRRNALPTTPGWARFATTYGERYQDINHAKDVRHNCDPSSTTTILKRVFFRCVLEATPCRGPSGSTGERVERRYEEETDDDDK